MEAGRIGWVLVGRVGAGRIGWVLVGGVGSWWDGLGAGGMGQRLVG